MEALDPVFRHLTGLRNPGLAAESGAQQRLYAPILSSRNLELHGFLCLEAFSGSLCGTRVAGASLPRPRPESAIWCSGILHLAHPDASSTRALVQRLSLCPSYRP